jgi:hypothetical protein
VRERALTLLAWLVMGTSLLACGTGSAQSLIETTATDEEARVVMAERLEMPATHPAEAPPIPEGAKEALDAYYGQAGYRQYSVLTAQRANQVVGIDETLGLLGVTPRRLHGMDEVWCITAEPAVSYEISFYQVPVESEWIGRPRSPAVWAARVVLLVRRGDTWEAAPVWDYFEHDPLAGSDGVASQIYFVLRALGCK